MRRKKTGPKKEVPFSGDDIITSTREFQFANSSSRAEKQPFKKIDYTAQHGMPQSSAEER